MHNILSMVKLNSLMIKSGLKMSGDNHRENLMRRRKARKKQNFERDIKKKN